MKAFSLEQETVLGALQQDHRCWGGTHTPGDDPGQNQGTFRDWEKKQRHRKGLHCLHPEPENGGNRGPVLLAACQQADWRKNDHTMGTYLERTMSPEIGTGTTEGVSTPAGLTCMGEQSKLLSTPADMVVPETAPQDEPRTEHDEKLRLAR